MLKFPGDTESQPQAIGGGTYAKSMPNCVAFGCEFKDEVTQFMVTMKT